LYLSLFCFTMCFSSSKLYGSLVVLRSLFCLCMWIDKIGVLFQNCRCLLDRFVFVYCYSLILLVLFVMLSYSGFSTIVLVVVCPAILCIYYALIELVHNVVRRHGGSITPSSFSVRLLYCSLIKVMISIIESVSLCCRSLALCLRIKCNSFAGHAVVQNTVGIVFLCIYSVGCRFSLITAAINLVVSYYSGLVTLYIMWVYGLIVSCFAVCILVLLFLLKLITSMIQCDVLIRLLCIYWSDWAFAFWGDWLHGLVTRITEADGSPVPSIWL
jgi:hypothetical protein